MNLRSEMSDGPMPPVSAMEGKSFYNKYAAIPAAGGMLALPLLEQAARLIHLEIGDRPIVIADYGSSEGKNSLAPMRAAIAVLRARAGLQRPIFVYHTDLPANDFNTLFELLQSDPDSYVRGGRNVFSTAIGRSFYQSVLPPSYVDLAWSSYAAVWLSQIRALTEHSCRAACSYSGCIPSRQMPSAMRSRICGSCAVAVIHGR